MKENNCLDIKRIHSSEIYGIIILSSLLRISNVGEFLLLPLRTRNP
jgi:hypothetical protein